MSHGTDQIDGTQKRNFTSLHQVTTGQAAALLGVASRTIAKWIDTGKIPSWRINKDRRVLVSDLVKFAETEGIPINIHDEVCAMKVDQSVVMKDKKINEMQTKIDALNSLVVLAEECLSKGTVSLGDSRTARVDADARRKFLDSLKLFKMTA